VLRIKPTAMLFLLGGLMVAMALVGGAACGGGGKSKPLTLEEYFQRVDTGENALTADSNALNDRFQALSDEEFLAQASDLLGEQLTVLRTFVKALDDIEPPAEAKDVHEKAVGSGHDLVDAYAAALPAVKDATTADEVFTKMNTDDFTTASDAFTQGCVDLQKLADDNHITVDLSCTN
jgi:hypothetical protein